MRTVFRAIIFAASLFSALPLGAQPEGPERTLESLFEEERVDRDRFAPSFLSEIPAAEVTRIIEGIKRDFGALAGIEATDDGFSLRFARAKVPARIVLDDEGRIAGLWFGPPLPQGDIEAQAAAIMALPGQTSLLVLSDGKPVVTHEAETPLAVGSGAKLAVLLALERAVAEGRLDWTDVAELEPGWKSLPSGQLQDWPEGAPLTIASLAHLMISISDNTATDGLIDIVGRAAVEAVSPRNRPFLTTRELSILKTQENAPLRQQWRSADAPARQAILDRIAKAPLPSPGSLSPATTHEVGWFMTARELCDLLDATSGLPSLGIQPGPADRRRWKSVAYKGGSEVGVLNLSSRLVGEDGGVHCVVATWNGDDALQQDKLLNPYRSLVDRLAAKSD